MKITARSHKIIKLASLAYLSLPIFIFSLSWLNLWIGIPLASLLLIAIAFTLKHIFKDPSEKTIEIDKKLIIVGGLIMLSWLLLSGIGSVGLQNSDYFKHNAIFQDLINKDWPVSYTIDGSPQVLVYNVAYYLPIALLGKLFGPGVINVCSLLWAGLGLGLIFYWACKITNRFKLLTLGIFILFSGLDVVLFLLNREGAFTGTSHIEWFEGFQYSSNTTLLFWVPQHCIAGWLAISMLLDSYYRNDYRHALLVIGLTFLWSPFIALGLTGFILFTMATNMKSLQKFITFPNITGIAVGSIQVLYLISSSHTGNVSSLTFINIFEKWPSYVLFLFAQVLIFLLFIRKKGLEEKDRRLLIFSLAFLTALPLFKYGEYNDLVMRTSIPLLFTIYILIIKNIEMKELLGSKALVLIAVLCAFTPLTEISRSIEYMAKSKFNPEQCSGLNSLAEMDEVLRVQYIGKSNRLTKYLLGF